MNDKEAIATGVADFSHASADSIPIIVRETERLVAYKLRRLCELSGITNPDVSVQWTCTAIATPGTGRELT